MVASLRKLIVGPCMLGGFSFSTLALSSAASAETSRWSADSLQLQAGRAVLEDSAGAFELVMEPADGLEIGPAPDLGEAKQSLLFTGTQDAAFRTTLPFPPVTDSLKVTLTFNPGDYPADQEDGTLLRFATQWEIRYWPTKSMVGLIIWTDANQYVSVAVPALPGVWQELTATINSDFIMIENDGKTEEKPLPLDLRPLDGTAALIFGGSRPTPSEESDGLRRWIGAIGTIAIEVN